MTLAAPYDRLLLELPGVRSMLWSRRKGSGASESDAVVKLRTVAGVRSFDVEVRTSHLSGATVERFLGRRGRTSAPLLLLAPQVGSGIAAKLIEAGISYLDTRGNCHIDAPPLFVHIEGRSAPELPRTARGIRAAGYQTLFVFLAEPESLNATVRSVAELAGVSRQAVSDMRRRLVEDEYLLETKGGLRWNPRRSEDALGLWLGGYEATVRPSLLWGTYRTEAPDPAAVERRIVKVAKSRGLELRWGGSAAGARLTGHYRGEVTVAHAPSLGDLPALLGAVPDRHGNLSLFNAFGSVNWEAAGKTVHPLLVYSEMLAEPDERAREAAREVYERFVRSPHGGGR